MSKMNGWLVVGGAMAALVVGVWAGNLNPSAPPGPTMVTLQDIYLAVTANSNSVDTSSGTAVAGEILSGKKAWVKGSELTGTMPNIEQNITPGTSAQTISAGYHTGSGTVAGDADLVAVNIKKDVNLFGVTGSLGRTIPKTGQTTSYLNGDDGSYQMGDPWPNPRFTVQADTNCVLDNLTGLIWARNANMGGQLTWSSAINYCENLTYGGQTDWRLPNRRELFSLIDDSQYSPALPSGHPFSGVQSDYYWSSSTYADHTDHAWYVYLHDGYVHYHGKTYSHYVWPVRAGQ